MQNYCEPGILQGLSYVLHEAAAACAQVVSGPFMQGKSLNNTSQQKFELQPWTLPRRYKPANVSSIMWLCVQCMCAPLCASGVHMSGMHGWILSVRSSEMNKTDDTTSAAITCKWCETIAGARG